MLHALKALGSIKCCFTANDFDDALIDIDAILRDLGPTRDWSLAPLELNDKRVKLEAAFALALLCLTEAGSSRPDKQLIFLFADILMKYAVSIHEENYFAAKQVLLASLNLHFYSIGLIDECTDMRAFASLQDLSKQADVKSSLFNVMEHIAATTDPSRCATAALKSSFVQSYPERRLISLAQTFRYLGHCFHNLDSHKHICKENDRLFNNLFQSCEALLFLVDNNESKRELADLYSETTLCDKALHYDSSNEMKVRIANNQFQTLFSTGNEEEAIKEIDKAITMAETLNDSEQNRFLLANLHYNLAFARLSPGSFDAEQAEINFNRAARYASQSRERGRDHILFAVYDMRIAEFKMAKGELREAKIATERALDTLMKYPRSQQPHIFKAQALQAMIRERQKGQ